MSCHFFRRNKDNIKPSIEAYDKETDSWDIAGEMGDVPWKSCIVPVGV